MTLRNGDAQNGCAWIGVGIAWNREASQRQGTALTEDAISHIDARLEKLGG